MGDIDLIVRIMCEDSLDGFFDPVDVRYGVGDGAGVGGGGAGGSVSGSGLVGSDELALASRFVELVGGVDRALELVGKVGEVVEVLDGEVLDAAVIDRISELL